MVRDETERYVRGVADVSVGYYDALLDLAAIYNPPFFEQAVSRRRPPPSPSPPKGVIELRGVSGDNAVATFTVDNTGTDTEEVAFGVSEFSGPPGTLPFRPPLRVHPPRFVLGPLESQVVSMRLALLSGLFLPNSRYTATLTVRKRDAFDLTIDVVAGAAPNATLIVRPLPGEVGSG